MSVLFRDERSSTFLTTTPLKSSQQFDRGVLVRLTDSARDNFFDTNGDPKEVRVIKNETSGCIKVGDDVFEFDIVKETGRCEIVEFEYVSLLFLYETTHVTHTYIYTTATPRKQ